MISSTTPPRSKSQLVQAINRLPTNVNFDVIEVLSSTDKPAVVRLIDTYMKKGSLSIIIIEN